MAFDPRLIDRPLADSEFVSRRLAVLGGAVAGWVRSLHWAWQVTLVWALTRGFTTLVVMAVASHQGANPWSPAQPGYLAYINGWDAGYYEQIHDAGYPATLPRDASGNVVGNVWAFMPAFPMIVKAITATTGLGWLVVAPVVSTLASLGFLLVAYRLFRLRASGADSLTAVAAVSLGTAAAILQFPYAESLGLLLVATLLLLLATGRYWWCLPVLVALALTRPWSVPAAAACLAVTVLTVLAHRRAGAPVPVPVRWSLAAVDVVALASAALWPLVAGAVTHTSGAYLLTEAAWHGGESQVPFLLFVKSFVIYFGKVPGVVVAGVALVLLAVMMFTRPVRALGGVMWAWVGSMLGYLVAIVPVNTSFIRLTLPLFPLMLVAVSLSTSRAYRTLLLLALAISQAAWLMLLWRWSDAGLTYAP